MALNPASSRGLAPVTADAYVIGTNAGQASLDINGDAASGAYVDITDDGNGFITLDATAGVVIRPGNPNITVLDIRKSADGSIYLRVDQNGNIIVPAVPAVDPSIAGAIYNVAGTLHISAG